MVRGIKYRRVIASAVPERGRRRVSTEGEMGEDSMLSHCGGKTPVGNSYLTILSGQKKEEIHAEENRLLTSSASHEKVK